MSRMNDTYHWRSPVGVFWIRPKKLLSGTEGYWLGLEEEALGFYHSPQKAADDVYSHASGASGWDDLDGKVEGPVDISEWEKGIPDR